MKTNNTYKGKIHKDSLIEDYPCHKRQHSKDKRMKRRIAKRRLDNEIFELYEVPKGYFGEKKHQLLKIKEKETMKEIKIKYFTDKIEKLTYIGGSKRSNWIDLRAAETIEVKAGDFKLIPLGVAMKLPEGYEAHIAPRSSTFKTWGLIQVNSVGVVDQLYCGDTDQWMMPVYATRDTVINVNDRVCQFRIIENQPEIEFVEVEHMEDESRGGFGSSGKQ